MDDDNTEEPELEVSLKEIEAEIWRRKRAKANDRKAEDARMLIEAGEGRVNFRYLITITKIYLQGLGKRKKKPSKKPVSFFLSPNTTIMKNIVHVSMVRGRKKKKTTLTEC